MKYSLPFCCVLLLAGCASAPPASQASTPSESSRTAAKTETQTTANNPAAAKPTAAQSAAQSRREFRRWVARFRADAAGQGIDKATLDHGLGQAELLPRVIELDNRQPEFTRAVWEYLDTAVSDTRIANGRAKLAANREAADTAAERYGVPAEILVAIWGIESNYGSNFGSFETIDALATLGYDGRREAFARRELLAALQILQAGDIDRERMQGSWAGGMGHTQFLPSSFQAYAVDADGDGRRDIWGSIADVMASTANYLARANWQPGEPWGVEVRLPESFDYARASMGTRLASGEWAALGVRPVNSRRLPEMDDASVLTPAGARGPAFLVGQNFRSILRYNNSTSYALAVGHLSDRIAGGPPIAAGWPRGLAALSRSQIKQLQQRLNERGFDAGTPDGLAGPNTRKALRAYQRSQGWVADGYPTFAILESLKPEAPSR